jgi:hypothetical protein
VKYGVDFWCIAPDGAYCLDPVWPDIKPFAYPDNGSRGFWLREDFTVEFFYRGQWWRLTARAGFDFDGASIPKWAWSIIGDPLALDILVAALFHDLFFCCHPKEFPLALTNDLFREFQQAYSSVWAKRNVTTKAVQAAGWTRWPKTADELEKYQPFLVVQKADDQGSFNPLTFPTCVHT